MRIVPVVALLAVLACGSDGPSEPTNANTAGTWALQTVNGIPLPYLYVQNGPDKGEVLSDLLILTSAGNFTEKTTIRRTVNGQVTTEPQADVGTYVITGNTVTFFFTIGGGSGVATLNGDSMTIPGDGGIVTRYTRQ
jgi:hypothetical protein